MVSEINSNRYFALIADARLIFRKRNNSQFRFALYPALMKSVKISLEFCLALSGYQLMPLSDNSPMFCFDAKLVAKSLPQ